MKLRIVLVFTTQTSKGAGWRRGGGATKNLFVCFKRGPANYETNYDLFNGSSQLLGDLRFLTQFSGQV